MTIQNLEPIYEFAPILRVDDEQRMVEGYAFQNEVCEGEGGVRLLRSAMENATAEYVKWGTLRSMHQPSTPGVTTSVVWDEKGAKITAHIVDDQEWRKVKAGVYKGFSVGVRAKLMRGKNVEVAEWVENSLVDRPKDPGALFTAFRAEDYDAPSECQVIEEEEATEINRVEEAPEVADAPQVAEDANDAPSTELDAEATSEEEAPVCARCAGVQDIDLSRVDGLNAELVLLRAKASQAEDAIQRLSTAENELTAVRRALEAANGRVRDLEAMPKGDQPVRYPAAFERTFAANAMAEEDGAKVAKLQAEYAQLVERLRGEDEQTRFKGAVRLTEIKGELDALRR